MSAVALEGFGELCTILHNARKRASSPDAEPRDRERLHGVCARKPALYEAMFTLLSI